MFTEDDRVELGKFLRSGSGANFLNHLREHPAKMPPHFTPADGNMQPHHIQLHYAFGVGETAKLDQILKLLDPKTPPKEPEPIRLHDTKSLT